MSSGSGPRRLRSQGRAEEGEAVESSDNGQAAEGQGQVNSEAIGDILAPKEKIMPFQIAKLDSSNSRYWFNDMKDQLRLQKAWKVVETYLNIGNKDFTSLRL